MNPGIKLAINKTLNKGIQFEDEDSEFYNKRGQRTKKLVEDRVEQASPLTGNAGRELYLECFQLILRRQVYHLIKSRHFPEQFETVVQDLWSLRVRYFGCLQEEEVGTGEELGGDKPEVGSDVQLFSSQPTPESPDSKKKEGVTRRMPRPVDTLALCYLGGILVRLPLRVGDLCRWAMSGELPFFGQVSIAISQHIH